MVRVMETRGHGKEDGGRRHWEDTTSVVKIPDSPSEFTQEYFSTVSALNRAHVARSRHDVSAARMCASTQASVTRGSHIAIPSLCANFSVLHVSWLLPLLGDLCE
jgi:hypothetical protein